MRAMWKTAIFLAAAVFTAVDGGLVAEMQRSPQSTSLSTPRKHVETVEQPSKQKVGYPVEVFPRGNRTVFAIESLQDGRVFVVALGKDGQLWRVYQKEDGSWTPWKALTDLCPSGQNPKRKCKFDGDPAIGKNADGRLEIFMRLEENLDLWQMYQTDPNDPEKWIAPREGSCVDQDQQTAIWYCLEKGVPAVQTASHYWIIDSPVFPTSDVSVNRHPISGKLQVFYRNFEGHMYRVEQVKAGHSELYSSPIIVSPNVLFV